MKEGDRVRFKGYSPEEITPDPPTFEPGDILEIVHLGGVVSDEELHAVRLRDGTNDMVWPEEVEPE